MLRRVIMYRYLRYVSFGVSARVYMYMCVVLVGWGGNNIAQHSVPAPSPSLPTCSRRPPCL